MSAAGCVTFKISAFDNETFNVDTLKSYYNQDTLLQSGHFVTVRTLCYSQDTLLQSGHFVTVRTLCYSQDTLLQSGHFVTIRTLCYNQDTLLQSGHFLYKFHCVQGRDTDSATQICWSYTMSVVILVCSSSFCL